MGKYNQDYILPDEEDEEEKEYIGDLDSEIQLVFEEILSNFESVFLKTARTNFLNVLTSR